MYNLYLDDHRHLQTKYPNAKEGDWVVVRNYEQFVDTVETRGTPRFVSFDFDLGRVQNSRSIGKKTGLDCAIYLLEKCLEERSRFPKWAVHSANPVWGKKLHEFLRVSEKILNT